VEGHTCEIKYEEERNKTKPKKKKNSKGKARAPRKHTEKRAKRGKKRYLPESKIAVSSKRILAGHRL
jgi:hypothetical protein